MHTPVEPQVPEASQSPDFRCISPSEAPEEQYQVPESMLTSRQPNGMNSLA